MDIQKIREQFPILKRQVNGCPLVYFDNAATTQKPRMVVDGMSEFYYNHYANIHRGVHTLSAESTQMVDEAREKVAVFIGASDASEVIFVRNATEALNLLMYTLGENVRGGDNIVTSVMEHHSNLVPWQVLSKKRKASLRVVEINEEGRLVLEGMRVKNHNYDLGGLYDLVDKNTKILAISMASNVTGVINPVKQIVKRVREINDKVVVVIDASQVVGHMPLNVLGMDADAVVFSGHKMYGPSGVGVLWGKKAFLKALPPFLYGGDMIAEVKLSDTTYAELPNKFEAGTPAIAEIVSLGYAVDFLSELGMEKVKDFEDKLLRELLEQMVILENEGKVKIIGPRSMESRASLVSFSVNNVHAHDIATFLDNKGIAVRSGQHCAAPLISSFSEIATVRISLSFINTISEIKYCLQALREAYDYFSK